MDGRALVFRYGQRDNTVDEDKLKQILELMNRNRVGLAMWFCKRGISRYITYQVFMKLFHEAGADRFLS